MQPNFQDNASPPRPVNDVVQACVLIGLSALLAFADESPTQHLLRAVESRYNRAHTLQVKFSETYSGLGRGPRTESGTLYLRKPGRMRWDYTEPPGKLFVSDGKEVYLYLPSEKRAEKMPLKETEDMRAPLAFLLGKLNFEREFHNIQARPVEDGSVVTAEPRSPSLPAYSQVEFLVSPAFEIRKLHIVGQDQSVLDFTFGDEKLNPALANSMFHFQPPPGTEVVDSGSAR